MNRFTNPRKCLHCKKTIYNTREQARTGMMRVISHDPGVNMLDMHTYECPHSNGKYHFGHKSYYEQSLDKDNTVSIGVSNGN